MISYIKSELFRAKKTKAFRYLILAVAIFVPLIITLSATNTKFDIDYYSGAGELAIGFGTIVVSCIALFFIFKNKDTKTQIIGYGIKKEKTLLVGFYYLQFNRCNISFNNYASFNCAKLSTWSHF